jgi:hypothetical protein
VKVDTAEHQRPLRIQPRWKTDGMYPSDGRGSLAGGGARRKDITSPIRRRDSAIIGTRLTVEVKADYSLVSNDGRKLD